VIASTSVTNSYAAELETSYTPLTIMYYNFSSLFVEKIKIKITSYNLVYIAMYVVNIISRRLK